MSLRVWLRKYRNNKQQVLPNNGKMVIIACQEMHVEAAKVDTDSASKFVEQLETLPVIIDCLNRPTNNNKRHLSGHLSRRSDLQAKFKNDIIFSGILTCLMSASQQAVTQGINTKFLSLTPPKSCGL